MVHNGDESDGGVVRNGDESDGGVVHNEDEKVMVEWFVMEMKE